MNEMVPIAVKSATGAWTAAGIWTLVIMAVAGVVTAVVKIAPRWRELGIGEQGRLRDQLGARIEKLEERLDSQGKRHDAHIEILRQLHEGEIALLRHRLNGEEQVNLALMTVIKTLDVSHKALEAIDATRARKQEAIAAEQAEMTKLRTSAIEKIAMLQEHLA